MAQHAIHFLICGSRENSKLEPATVVYSCPFACGIMAPKNKAKAAPKAEPKAKKPEALVVADDPTPAEMKASIQRMLNLVKYKADPLKNKSGDRLTEAQEVLEAKLHLSIVRHLFSKFLVTLHVPGLPTDLRLGSKRLRRCLPEAWAEGLEVDGPVHQEGGQGG